MAIAICISWRWHLVLFGRMRCVGEMRRWALGLQRGFCLVLAGRLFCEVSVSSFFFKWSFPNRMISFDYFYVENVWGGQPLNLGEPGSHLEAILRRLGFFRCHIDASWGLSRLSWGPVHFPLCLIWVSWGLLGPSWGHMGPSWGNLGLGPSLLPVGSRAGDTAPI